MKYAQETVVENLKRLKKELGHEPTVTEIESCEYLPNARYIQRNFNGVRYLRKLAGFNAMDHTIGDIRRNTALKATERAKQYEQKLYMDIVRVWHKDNTKVIREFAYQQYVKDGDWYKNIFSDVAIVDNKKNHITLIDFFYPQDMASFGGCVRQKRKKLLENPVSLLDGATHEVFFVCVNPAIDRHMINKNGTDKSGVNVLSLEEFQTKYML